MYVNQEIAKSIEQRTFVEFNQQLINYVPKTYVNNIKKDNFEFLNQVTIYQVQRMALQISEKYKQRLDRLTQIINSNDSSL